MTKIKTSIEMLEKLDWSKAFMLEASSSQFQEEWDHHLS